MRKTQSVKTTEHTGNSGDRVIRSEHPAFGQISVSRHTGGEGFLYGSDFVHHTVVHLTVSKSETDRHLCTDWPYSRDTVVELDMSEAQWATLVSSFGLGGGVPCTLRQIGNDSVPEIESIGSRKVQLASEVCETMKQFAAQCDELNKGVLESGLSAKKTNALLHSIEVLKSHILSNVEFVSDQFEDHAEKVVAQAKIEIHAHINNAVRDAGLQALGPSRILELEGS